MEIGRRPKNLKEGLRGALPWALFLLGAFCLFRPALLTTVAADDLINPFSQTYHAGTTPGSIWRRVVQSVSITGHFNYLGQFFGSMVVAVWAYLIGNFGIRFSLVNALTKYVFYVLVILVIAAYAKTVIEDAGKRVSTWSTRAVALAALALPIQLHIPWSNDPVASYPMAGYGTALIGVLFIWLTKRAMDDGRLVELIGIGLLGSCAVLYYEFNSFAILATSVFLLSRLRQSRQGRRPWSRECARYLMCVGPAAATTLFFFFRNRAASANYSGTALSFSPPFLEKLGNGLVSSLPGSSLPLAHDWLGHTTKFNTRLLQYFALGIVCVALLFWLERQQSTTHSALNRHGVTRIAVGVSPVLIYWFGATFAQTATKKVQVESQRIGQVYNYYAVGSVALCLVAVVLGFAVFPKIRARFVAPMLLTVAVAFGSYQYATNWNVLLAFNQAMKPTSELLVAFSEKPEMSIRCAKLDAWKAMGWPEYYWLDLELGMNLLYQINRQESFCQR